jgi:hypothetical protein
MMASLPDFKPTFDLLEGYRKDKGGFLEEWQALIVKEAIIRLGDLELLAGRIHVQCKRLLHDAATTSGPGLSCVDVMEALKEASDKGPALAKWFADNPSPQLDNISVALMLGGDEGRESLEKMEEQQLRLDTELFYYLAHRFCTCLALLPGLRGFECKEVAIIRNQLLEHPEKPYSGVLLPSFSYRPEVGPVIKGMRYSHQSEVHPDAGFIPNCRALLDAAAIALRSALTSSLNGAPNPTDP